MDNQWHLATAFERIGDAVPDAPAIIDGRGTLSWSDYDDQAARLCAAFMAHGIAADDTIAICAQNCREYLIAQYAAFKGRMSPINVNFRYQPDELAYLLDNADAVAIVYQQRFADKIAAVRGALPKLRVLIEIDDDGAPVNAPAVSFDAAITGHAPAPRIERSGDDTTMLYTGGTTGLPKGVVYVHESLARTYFAILYQRQGLAPPATPNEIGAVTAQVHAAGKVPRSIPASPLMHATGMWIGVFMAHALGGCVILSEQRSFDAAALLALAQDTAATEMTITGDVFARPMLDVLDAAEAAGRPYALGALQTIRSSGVMFAIETKRALLRHLDVTIIDSMGSSEGAMGISTVSRTTADAAGTGKFDRNATTRVVGDDGRDVAPGSAQIGRIWQGGTVPVGYYKDPAKTAETFRTVDGVRYAIPGDFARVAADGSIILLGRGSICINTGGEKVFAEEVEEVVKAHPAVEDALVVGIPDARFGERVAALVVPRSQPAFDRRDLEGFVRARLSDYKLPRTIITVDGVPRGANGKADYQQAKAIMLASQTSEAA